jgi:predicted RNA-binding protein with PIN domain
MEQVKVETTVETHCCKKDKKDKKEKKCKKGKKEHHCKREELEKQIETLGIKNQIDFLVSKGFKVKKAFKALLFNEHNQEKALAYLEDFKTRKLKRKQDKLWNLQEEAKTLGLEGYIEYMKANVPGEVKLKEIVKALKKFNLDQEKAAAFLKEKKLKKTNKREEKYKELFPNDTEFNWEKFKTTKKELKLKKKEDKYRKVFPDDKDINWDKYKQFKLAKKLIKKKQHMARDTVQTKEWKEGLKTLYLDGNNLLFIDQDIREMFLAKNTQGACDKLLEYALGFAKSANVNIVLIFDVNQNNFSKESEGVKVDVVSAKPNFKNSDDAIVSYASGLNEADLQVSIFVTADRELTYRLIEKGAVNVMKSSTWWKIMKTRLGLNKPVVAQTAQP